MTRRFLTPAVSLAAASLFWAACGGNINSKEAVRQAVIDHLASRKGLDLDLKAMDVEVSSVTFRSNEADTMVSFRPKGGSGDGMQMKYTLERSGGRWKVKSKAETGATPHGQGGMPVSPEMPPGHPPMGAESKK